MARFSIIIPVYQTERYLGKCIDSVLNQSFGDFQLILVDNASPDCCGDICENYAREDSRIKTIHLPVNRKPAGARNAGLDAVTGEYVLFLDSDDELAADVLEHLDARIQANGGKELCFAAYLNFLPDDKLVKEPFYFSRDIISSADSMLVLAHLLERNASIWSVWRHVFSQSLISSKQLRFDESLIGPEDCDFFINAVLAADSFDAVDLAICSYRVGRTGSTMNKVRKETVVSNFQVSIKWFEYFQVKYMKNRSEAERSAMERFANMFCDSLGMIGWLDNHEKEELLPCIREHIEILKHVKGVKHQIAVFSYRLLGFKRGSRFLAHLYAWNVRIKCAVQRRGS